MASIVMHQPEPGAHPEIPRYQAGIWEKRDPATEQAALLAMYAAWRGHDGPIIVEEGDDDGLFLVTVPPTWEAILTHEGHVSFYFDDGNNGIVVEIETP